MYSTQIQPGSTKIHQFGASRAPYGPICLLYGILGPFWAVPEPWYGTPGWVKRLKHIHLDVSHLDPTWIHLDPPIWSLQGGLWPNMPHLWHIGAVFGHKNGQKGQKLMGSTWISYFLNQTDKIEPLVRPK